MYQRRNYCITLETWWWPQRHCQPPSCWPPRHHYYLLSKHEETRGTFLIFHCVLRRRRRQVVGETFYIIKAFFHDAKTWTNRSKRSCSREASILESSFNYSFRRTAELKNKGQKEALPQKWKVSCSSILYGVQDQGTKAEGGAYSFTGGCKLTETQPGITSSVVLVTCCSNDIDLLKNLTQVWSATFY